MELFDWQSDSNKNTMLIVRRSGHGRRSCIRKYGVEEKYLSPFFTGMSKRIGILDLEVSQHGPSFETHNINI